MTVLRLSDIQKSFGPRKVLDGFELHLVEGERVGLIGANGSGKSTVLKMVTGLEHCDSGEVHVSPGLDVGHFTQMIELDPARTVFESVTEGVAFIHDLEKQIHEVAHQLAEATDPDEIERLGRKHDRLVHEFEAHDGYNVDNRVETLLSRFGIGASDFDRPVGEFSGGWQKRIALAQVLVRNPELLLLDEPTNHLDADTVEWLEGMLASYRGTLLIVTHDRYFLDNVVSRIVELEHGRSQSYPGTYSDYLDEKTRRLEAARRAWDRQQQMLAREREYIERTRAGQKHKQSTSRQKRLEKIDLVDKPEEAGGFNAVFRKGRRLGDLVLELQEVSKRYDRELLGGLSIGIASNERLGIIGPNGCGKSTLLKLITGKIEPDRGRVRMGSNTEPAYHDQELAELDDDQTL
ncbi:MAG: ABC-F family ATP-binding cassette domain-containing protein, partial [Planctomycetota bacterium]